VRPAEGRPTALIVGPNGRVDGEICVDRIIASGTIVGRIEVLEAISIHARARIQCDIEYAAMEIDPGADVQGRMTHRRRSAENSGPANTVMPPAAKEDPSAQPQ
jgi:cytoskeletal protein CcmA (bactofilin family)